MARGNLAALGARPRGEALHQLNLPSTSRARPTPTPAPADPRSVSSAAATSDHVSSIERTSPSRAAVTGATPGEFVSLLSKLEKADALPYALAAYGTARSQEIRALEWPEVDLEHGVMLLADDDEAANLKPRRIVPLARPLASACAPSGSAGAVRPRSGLPSAQGGALGNDLPRPASKARPQALGGLRPRADRPAGVPSHRRHLARPRRSRSESFLRLHGAKCQSANRMPRRSPCAATPMSWPASWNAPATSSTSSWLHAKPRKPTHPLSFQLPPEPGFFRNSTGNSFPCAFPWGKCQAVRGPVSHFGGAPPAIASH